MSRARRTSSSKCQIRIICRCCLCTRIILKFFYIICNYAKLTISLKTVNCLSSRPAEWRWKLPQVCDNEWHHYAVSVNFPNAELTVDGDRFVA